MIDTPGSNACMKPFFLAEIALLLFVPWFSGCALAHTTINEPLSYAQVQQLEPGTTTAKDAVKILGAPADVVQLGRRSAYRYDHRNSKRAGLFLVLLILFNEDTRTDRVWLFFDENEVLTHLGATFAANQTEYAMPWTDVHED